MTHERKRDQYKKNSNSNESSKKAAFYYAMKGVASLENRVKSLEVDMTDVKTRLAVAESNIKDVKEDISSIKSNTTWILRIIVGAIVLALLGLIFKGGI